VEEGKKDIERAVDRLLEQQDEEWDPLAGDEGFGDFLPVRRINHLGEAERFILEMGWRSVGEFHKDTGCRAEDFVGYYVQSGEAVPSGTLGRKGRASAMAVIHNRLLPTEDVDLYVDSKGKEFMSGDAFT